MSPQFRQNRFGGMRPGNDDGLGGQRRENFRDQPEDTFEGGVDAGQQAADAVAGTGRVLRVRHGASATGDDVGLAGIGLAWPG